MITVEWYKINQQATINTKHMGVFVLVFEEQGENYEHKNETEIWWKPSKDYGIQTFIIGTFQDNSFEDAVNRFLKELEETTYYHKRVQNECARVVEHDDPDLELYENILDYLEVVLP